MTRTATHHVIVLLIHGIIVTMNYIHLCRGPWETPFADIWGCLLTIKSLSVNYFLAYDKWRDSSVPGAALYITFGCNVCFNVIFRCHFFSIYLYDFSADSAALCWCPGITLVPRSCCEASDSASHPAAAPCRVTEQISAQSEVSCLLCGTCTFTTRQEVFLLSLYIAAVFQVTTFSNTASEKVFLSCFSIS